MEDEDGSSGQKIEPLDKAVTKITMRVAPEIIKAFETETQGLQIFEVKLTGLQSFAQFMAFSDFLKQEIDGVQTVMQTRIKGNAMTVQVEFEGKKDKFFKEISEHDAFPFSAAVQNTEEGEILINIE